MHETNNATMTAEARAARNAYRRKWAAENPEKVRGQQIRYWMKRAAEAQEVQEQDTRQTTEGDR